MEITTRDFSGRFPTLAPHVRDADGAALLALLEARTVELGEALVREGTASDAVFFVWDGTFVVKLHVGAAAREIGRCEPGAVVGEISFLDGGVATATLEAVTRSTVLALSREGLERLRASHPRLATAVLQTLCRSLAARVRGASDVLERALGHGGSSATQPVGWLEAVRTLLGLSEI